MKECINCKTEKQDSEFTKCKTVCDKCLQHYRTLKQREYYAKNKDKINEKRRREETWRINEKTRSRTINNQFRTGKLNIKSPTGQATITEHVVFTVLGDCVKLNTNEKFTSLYDLESKSLNNIDVKSSSLMTRYKPTSLTRWCFHLHINTENPDNFVCIGFNQDRSEIVKVWVIPGNCDKTHSANINVTNTANGLSKFKEYEVDAAPYNTIYKNLNIYELPEFRNLKQEVKA